jgi:tRNA threonylcarbamoyladenosine biosynthesis protein TsaE
MIALTLASPAQTRRFARLLAGLLEPPALVTVEGELGTGKTTLVREFLRARGVRGAITSPSFTLAQSYRGRHGERLHHLDLYRLSTGADVALFAWDDYLGPDALTFVEWPAAGDGVLPEPDVRLGLEHRTPRSRSARLYGPADLESAVAGQSAEAGIAVTRHPGVAVTGESVLAERT